MSKVTSNLFAINLSIEGRTSPRNHARNLHVWFEDLTINPNIVVWWENRHLIPKPGTRANVAPTQQHLRRNPGRCARRSARHEQLARPSARRGRCRHAHADG